MELFQENGVLRAENGLLKVNIRALNARIQYIEDICEGEPIEELMEQLAMLRLFRQDLMDKFHTTSAAELIQIVDNLREDVKEAESRCEEADEKVSCDPHKQTYKRTKSQERDLTRLDATLGTSLLTT